VAEYLNQTRTTFIAEAQWTELRARLAPVPESSLRRILRASGVPLAPLVEGVRQETPEELERTLLAIDEEYTAAVAAGDRERARTIRRLVIEAKDHAKLALRNPRTAPGKKAEKEEAVLWLLTWLENPGVFRAWLGLRKQTLSRGTGGEITLA
jgi:hypothetical protein